MVLLRAGGTRCSFDRAYRARLPSLRPRGAGATARDTVKAAAAASGRPHETAGAPDQFLDYYKLLGVEPSCAQADLKRAYRYLQKRCHPDIAGGALGHEMGVLLNDAYRVLSDPRQRHAFDVARSEAHVFEGFTGAALSSWAGGEGESRAVFVDEGACVGCLKCALEASSTFKVEMKYGKARAVTQWGDSEERIQVAAAICPVSCIHWVDRAQLPALEHTMRRDMQQGGGRPTGDPFASAAAFERKWTQAAGAGTGHSQVAPAQPPWAGEAPSGAVSSILRRGSGGSSRIWHALAGTAQTERRFALVPLSHARPHPWSRPAGVAHSYLEHMAARRRGAAPQQPAYAWAFMDEAAAPEAPVMEEEYWEHVEAQRGDGQAQRARFVRKQQEREAGTPQSAQMQQQYSELREAEGRQQSFNLMVTSALACLMLWGVRLHAEQQPPMSAAECFQHGGGLCRLRVE